MIKIRIAIAIIIFGFVIHANAQTLTPSPVRTATPTMTPTATYTATSTPASTVTPFTVPTTINITPSGNIDTDWLETLESSMGFEMELAQCVGPPNWATWTVQTWQSYVEPYWAFPSGAILIAMTLIFIRRIMRIMMNEAES